jgi:thiamine biosynthesis lipoprotein
MGLKVIESDHIMGGTFSVQTWAINEREAAEFKKIIHEGLSLVHELENKLTDFRESPFHKINLMAGREWVQVDQETYNLIKKSIEISRQTKGAFDISYATIGQLWRGARKESKVPDQKEIQKRLAYVDYSLIQFKDETCEVFLPNELMRIGLGGIGKGYAVDKLYEILLAKGISNFLVSGSGDVRVHSSSDAPRPWRLAIKNPFSREDKVAGHIELQNGSMATSGDYINYLKNQKGEEKLHHILQTKTGMPAVDIASCTIVSDETVKSDTMATSVIAMKSEDGIKFLNQEKIFGVIIRTNGEVLLSRMAMSHFGESARNKKVTA